MLAGDALAEPFKCPVAHIGGSVNINHRISCDPDSDICCNPIWDGPDRAYARFLCVANDFNLDQTLGSQACIYERIKRIGWLHGVNDANSKTYIQKQFDTAINNALIPFSMDCGDTEIDKPCTVIDSK